MDNIKVDQMIEILAALEHNGWSIWQRHVHSSGVINENGFLVLPPDLIEKWEKQITTSYRDLSEEDKEKDRAEVRRVLQIIMANMHDLDSFVAPRPLKPMKVVEAKYTYWSREILSTDVNSFLDCEGKNGWEAYQINEIGVFKTTTKIYLRKEIIE